MAHKRPRPGERLLAKESPSTLEEPALKKQLHHNLASSHEEADEIFPNQHDHLSDSSPPLTPDVHEPPLTHWLEEGEDREFPNNQSWKLTFVVPPIPPIADLSLMIDLYTNTTRDPNGKRNLQQHPRFSELESLGDSIANFLARDELPKILGHDNFNLIQIVSENARSNALFARGTEHYKLHKLVKSAPSNGKLWANIFEVWIACVKLERELYDKLDPLVDVRRFLSQIWSIRYRRLSQFFIRPLIKFATPIALKSRKNPARLSRAKDLNPEVTSQPIKYPSAIFEPVLGAMYKNRKKPPDERFVGFLATAKIAKHDQASEQYTAFSTDEIEAKEIAKRRCYMVEISCKSSKPSSYVKEEPTLDLALESEYDRVRSEIFLVLKSYVFEAHAMGRDYVPRYLSEKMRAWFESHLQSLTDKRTIVMTHCQKVV